MNLYIILLELSDIESISAYQEELGNVGEVAKLTETGLLFRTSMKASEVRDYLREHLNPQRCFVTKVNHGAAWNNVLVPNAVIKEWYEAINF